MCGFCKVWVCVCVDSVKCGSVYVWILYSVCVLVICVLVFSCFVLFRLCILFVLSVLVYGLLPQSEN